MKVPGISLLSLFLFLFLQSCMHDPTGLIGIPDDPGGGGTDTIIPLDPCDPDSTYFANDVLPILVSNCAVSGCHDAESHEEGIVFSTYADIMESMIEEDDLIVPGDPFDSKMIEAILEDDADDRMPPPPNTPLSGGEVDVLIAWIEQGALNNSCEGECDTTSVTYSGTIANIVSNYCLGCHSGTSPSGGISLASYSGVAEVAADGRLLGAVSGFSGYTPMPFGSDPLPACNIDQIRIWIEDGNQNN
ncbi:MAG: hypothetical protein H7X71_00595 [Chitinophagales bacterium]|nr:hypothetical protein [Chitinophagales bacterium]